MLKKIVTTLALFIIIASSAYAQQEMTNWLFGTNAGLSWNQTQSLTATGVYGTTSTTLAGLPTTITGSPMNTGEGCFSISDANGNLLFFSDGMTIWNKNYGIIASGLSGHSSSAQSGIALPYPQTPGKYIAVTLGEKDTDNLSYTVVDMALNSGLGGTVAGQVDIPLTNQIGILGESVAAVRHSNREDFWIIAVGRNAVNPPIRSNLNVWRVTSAGVQTSRYSQGQVPRNTTPTNPGGYIKFTKEGDHFVWIDYSNRFFAYGDFDTSTGLFANIRVRDGALNAAAPYGNGYGVEFSPSGRYLYLTYVPGTANTNQVSGILVYDFNALLASSTPNSINPVKTISNPLSLADGINPHFTSIQLGPDGRIYTGFFYSRSMFVIDNPENPTSMRIYRLNNILPSGSRVNLGLPNFAIPWVRTSITPPANAEACTDLEATYIVEVISGSGLANIRKVTVNFGDGNTQDINVAGVAGLYNVSYTYKTPGTYAITVNAYNAAGGVEILPSTSSVKINSCKLRVNPQVSTKNSKN